jgi:hypothetical protein
LKPTDCQYHYSSQGVWGECHSSTEWARSCVYGSNTNNCRFSHHPNGLVGSGTHTSRSNHYTHTVQGYTDCYEYCWARNLDKSDGFFQIPSNGHCYCYSGSNPWQSAGYYAFQMNC